MPRTGFVAKCLFFATMIVACAVCGCAEEEPEPVMPPPAVPMQASTPKPPVNAAPPRQPRPSLDEFIALMQKKDPRYIRYYVASPFHPEHAPPVVVWMGNVTYRDGVFTGTSHHPPKVSNVRHGEKSGKPRDSIVDWMMVTKDKRMVGGERLRAERAALQPHLRAAFDAKWDIKFD